MNYEQAKKVINAWKLSQGLMRKEIAETKEKINKCINDLEELNKQLEEYEKLPLDTPFYWTDGTKEIASMEDAIEDTKQGIINETKDKTYHNAYLCMVSHVHNGDMGRATRAVMKFKELQHEQFEFYGNNTDDLWYEDDEVGKLKGEGAYNEIAKDLARGTETADKLMELLELYLTAREVKQAKKNMRKRKKKKN